MKTKILTLAEDGKIEEKAIYTIDSKKALIAYIMQDIKKNFNTWAYPEDMEGIRESKTVKNHFYYDYKNIVIAAYPA